MLKIKKTKYETLEILTRDETSDLKSVEEVLEKGGYERKYFNILPNEKWLDAGVNIGAFSLLCHLRGAKSIGYEAEFNNAQLASLNLKQNNCEGTVIHAAIVSDQYEGESINLWLHNTDYGQWRHTLYKRNNKQQSVTVPAIKISEILPQFDCVKLDIEGAEIEILETVENWFRIKKLVFEYHFDTDSSVLRYNKIIAKLKTHFQNVKAPSIKEGIEHYTWFPQAKVVFCWNDS